MNKIGRFALLGLALVMAAALLPATGHPAQAAAVACNAPPTSCSLSAIAAYCNCFDFSDICAANLKASLCAKPSACADDGRVNTNCSAPEILYCNGDNADFYAYNFDTGKGEFDFSIPLADLMKSVEVKTLVKQMGDVKVYLLPDGTVELLAPQPDGKVYFMIFDPSNCASMQESAEWGLN